MLHEITVALALLLVSSTGGLLSPEPIHSPFSVQAPVPTPPPLFSAPCGTRQQPTDNALLVLRRAELRGRDYYLAFTIGGFHNDPTFPKGTRGGLLYLRLDDGPAWYVSPTEYPDIFYVTIAGLAKGDHKLVAALASHGSGSGMFAFVPTIVHCFTV